MNRKLRRHQERLEKQKAKGSATPTSPAVAQAFAAAYQHQQAGRVAEALAGYAQVLAMKPDYAEAHYNTGVIFAALGRTEAAIDAYRKAIAVRPDFPEALYNLGTIVQSLEQLEEAASIYTRAIALRPSFAEAHANFAVVLKDLGRLDAALAHCREAVRLRPAYPEAFNNMGTVYQGLGQPREAADAYRRSLALRPHSLETHNNFANALYALHRAGETEEAARRAQEWLAAFPDNPVARHMGTALVAGQAPERANDDYVRHTFDSFSKIFDQRLAQLGYRGPELIAGVLRTALPPANAMLEVLDAGCGTGLCCNVLRPYARRLVGVDLSQGMLNKAAARNAYDELVQSELTAYLLGAVNRFALIAAADVFSYFGDLARVLAAAAQALRPGGMLVFTCEQTTEASSSGYRIDPHGRFAHNENYLRRTLIEAGLDALQFAPDVLRHEGAAKVPCLVVSARRAAA